MNIRNEIKSNDNFKCVANVFHHVNSKLHDDFENSYLKLRSKEGRVYQDSVVAQLPAMDGAELDTGEWKSRQTSVKKIQAYLNSRVVKTCLEVGCGNGWLPMKA